MTQTNRAAPGARIAVALGAAILAVLAGAGCGPADDDSGGSGGLGAGPAPSASPSPTGAAGPPPGPSFPGTPRAYAEAVLAAWDAGDLGQLAELTTPMVHEQFVQIPGPPPPDWTWIQCDNIAYCTFYNSAGDYLALQVPVAGLGGPHNAVQLSLTSTTYPDDHIEYVQEFTAAWLNGNVARMHQLAVPAAVEVYLQRSPGPVSNYGLAGGGGGLSIIVVTGVGFEIETHVGTTLLGGPQAIRQAIPEI